MTEDTFRAALSELLAGEPLQLTFAANATEEDPDAVCYLGMEGAPRWVSPSPIWGPARPLTGIFFVVDVASDTPVLRLNTLSETWSAAQQADDMGLEPLDIATSNP